MYDIVKYLTPQSDIRIGFLGEYFLVASFNVDNNEKARVCSQKGFNHLLLLLEAELQPDRKNELIQKADEKYPYTLSVTNIPSIDFFLNKTFMKINLVGPYVKIHCRRFQIPNPEASPGEYECHSFGTSLEQVLEEIMNCSTFKLRETQIVDCNY